MYINGKPEITVESGLKLRHANLRCRVSTSIFIAKASHLPHYQHFHCSNLNNKPTTVEAFHPAHTSVISWVSLLLGWHQKVRTHSKTHAWNLQQQNKDTSEEQFYVCLLQFWQKCLLSIFKHLLLLFERQSSRERERERERMIFHLQIHAPNGHNS